MAPTINVVVDDLFEIGDDGSVVVRVHVQPGAGRTAVVGTHGDALKVRVAAPPEKGRANEACAALLASVLGLKASEVALSSGDASRSKRFTIAEADAEEIRRRLELALDEAAEPPGGNSRGSGRW